MAGWSEGDLSKNAGQSSLGVSAPGGKPFPWGLLLKRTYALYRSRFQTFFLIALPPSLLAYLCFFLQRILVGIIRDNGWLPPRRTAGYWTVLNTVAFFQHAVYWVISGFFLAAVASNVLQFAGGRKPLVSDAFSAAGKRLGSVAVVSLVIWTAFFLGRVILALAFFRIIDLLRLWSSPALVNGGFALILLLLAGLFSRAGPAIPILMDNPGITAWQSLRYSLVESEGCEPFFILFLAKSALLGYVGYWIVNVGLSGLAERGMLRAEAYPWVQGVFYICVAAMVEAPLFIAFSLLYRHSRFTRDDAVPAAVG